MSTKLLHSILLFVFAFFTLLASAQMFPTKADHDRKVDSLLNVLKTAKEDTSKVNTLNALSNEHFDWAEEERPKALEYAQSALLLSEKLNYKRGKATSYTLIAADFSIKKNLPESIKYYTNALNLFEELDDMHEVIKTHQGIAWAYNFIKDTTQALKHFDNAMKTSEQIGDKSYICGCYQLLGIFYTEHRLFYDALKNYLIGLKVCEEADSRETLAAITNNLSIVYVQLGNYPEALRHLLNSKKYSGRNPPAGNLANIYNNMGYYGETIKLYENLVERFTKENNRRNIASSNSQLGRVYVAMAESFIEKKYTLDSVEIFLAKAQEHYQTAKRIQVEIGLPDNIVTLFDKGNFFLMQALVGQKKGDDSELIKNKLDSALKYFVQDLDINTKKAEKIRFPGLYIKIGTVNSEKAGFLSGDAATALYNEAIRSVNQGLSFANEMSVKGSILNGYRALGDIYYKMKDYQKAFEYRSLYQQISDSVRSNETAKKFEQVRIINETEIRATEEKAKYEKLMADLDFNHIRKEDSLRYQNLLADEQLQQQEKDLKLKQTSLDLINKQNELNQLNYLNSQAALETEQVRREEKEKELTIANQEKTLQSSQLSLQQTQLNLKESQIQAERKQRLFYIGGIILLSLLFIFIYRNFKNRQKADRILASERLKSEKADAAHKMAELELQSLRAQLNPHFMFNSLNAIQELILKDDNDNSHLYLSRFSELLRMLLDNANQPFVSLRKEINLLELYLSLENLRIPDLKYSIEIDPSIDSNKTAIPNMMLQPYIENAIWHGLSHKKGERNLDIRIKRKEDLIVCEVEDNGVGRKMSAELKSLYRKEHRSKGMELLSKRFSLLSKEYGSEIHTTVEDLHDNGTALGTKVAISVPYSLTEQAKPVYS